METVTLNDPAALVREFVSALQRRQRHKANCAAFALLEQKAQLGRQWRSIAKVLHANGELRSANLAMALYVEQTGDPPAARFEKAALAAQTGRVEEAQGLMKAVPLDVPDHASHAFLLGTIALNLGDLGLAEEHLLRALDSNAKLGQAMLPLASCRHRPTGDPIGERILEGRSRMAAAPALERAQFHFAAGKIHLDRDEADEAFEDFSAGAAIAAVERPYDREKDRADALRSREGYNQETIEAIAAQVETDGSEAIFVTGLPRSGTTLVEQILVSHSAVVGGEELGRMSIVQRELADSSAAGLQSYCRKNPVDDLAQLYLHLCRERFGEGSRYVDKGLNNTRHIGLIASVLPRSPIIWLRRDPLDCAWSAFRTYFLRGVDWSWKLEDIAHHFLLEDELFEFWSALLPDRILPVQYADLVRDPQREIARILAHCGLEPEPQVFEPHKTARVVSTASVTQVREAINQRGLGSAEPFRAKLKPFCDAYFG